MLESLDVENLSIEKVVSMHRERDGKENAVQYDLYRQGRIKKEKMRDHQAMRCSGRLIVPSVVTI